MRKPNSQPTRFIFTIALVPLFTLGFFSIFGSNQIISKSSSTSLDVPLTIIEGTVPLSEELRGILQTALEEASQEVAFESEYFAPTDLEDQEDWVFVSMVGLSNIPESQQWNILDHGSWFGHVLIHYQAGIFSQAAVVGTQKYNTLVNGTPDSLISRSAKLELTGEALPSAEAGGYIFPYPSGYRIHYGSSGVHGGWSMYGVDLGSNGDTSAGNVPNYLIASADGTVTYKCVLSGSGKSATVRIGDFLYAHLLGSTVSLNLGDFVSQGDYLGRLKTGTFDELPCGYAYQSDNWFHVHFGFLDDPLTLGNWSLDTTGSEIWTNGSNTWPVSTWKMIGSSICATVTDVPQAECEVLRDLYYATGGGAWVDQTGWLESDQVCTWYGISCSSGHITEINLATNNLSGSLTTNFSGLTSLSRLEISGNPGLTGDISTVINHLPTGLNFLILRGNSLAGIIPPAIANFTNLFELALENNDLSGDLTTIIGYLPANLYFLYLDGNNFTGTIPTSVSNLTHLGALTVGINQLSGDLGTIIAALPASLNFLSINDNNFSGTIPSSISNLTNLFLLDISQNPALAGTVPVSITGLGLSLFDFQDTPLCEPIDPTYDAWKAGVTYYYPGQCGAEILTNNSFETYIPISWQDGKQLNPADGPDCGAGNAHTGSCAVHFEGDGSSKRVFMRYKLAGVAGDNFNLSIYRMGLSVPAADGAFIKATLYYNDGTEEVFKVNLDTGNLANWEQFTLPFSAAKDYKRVNIDMFYKKASGTLWLDDISLTRNGGAELLENTSFEIYKPDDYIRSV
ncbi:MAG: hypothetical protein P8Y68_19285, partial [Anaerolineales bacterium]